MTENRKKTQTPFLIPERPDSIYSFIYQQNRYNITLHIIDYSRVSEDKFVPISCYKDKIMLTF